MNLMLIMSVLLLNDCVILPDAPDWKHNIQVIDKWPPVSISQAVTGAEDRLTGDFEPFVSQDYWVLAGTVPERARLDARLRAALKSGRACAPFWARAQYLAALGSPTVAWDAGLGGFKVEGLIPGQGYWYAPGPTDGALLVPTLDGKYINLYGAGSFVPPLDWAVIMATENPGTVTVYSPIQAVTEGLWPWEVQAYAAFYRRPDQGGHTAENRQILVNVGGSASGDWLATGTYVSGGSNVSTGSAIDTSLVLGLDPAPAAVYQTAHNLTLPDPVELSWNDVGGWYDTTALTPGTTYWYEAGDCDSLMIYLKSNGTYGSLQQSGTFTAEANLAIVFAPQNYANVGTIRAFGQITGQIGSLAPGIGCLVRLHFAEIEGLGGSRLRTFDLTVQGRETITCRKVCTYALAGTTLNRAAVMDFRLEPDANGQIKFTLSPCAPHFAAGLNGIEVYQQNWEMKQLDYGTTYNLLIWDGFLKWNYQVGAPVFPVLFGTPRCQKIQATTNYLAEYHLSIEEPIGTGDPGVPSQVAETCPVPITVPVTRDWDPPVGGEDKRYVWITYWNNTAECSDYITDTHFTPISVLSGQPVLCHAITGSGGKGTVLHGTTVQCFLIEVDGPFVELASEIDPEWLVTAVAMDVTKVTWNAETQSCSLTSDVVHENAYYQLAQAIRDQTTEGHPDYHTGLIGDPCVIRWNHS